VRAPTLLLVGERDVEVLQLNRAALERLGTATRQLVIVPGATHLFEEPGALEQVALHAGKWFCAQIPPGAREPTEAREPLRIPVQAGG
jgi:hypothetical protein